MKEREYTCPAMVKKVISDNPSITESKYYEKCPPGSYKGSIVVDPGNTYHFYRQNKDGTWSLSKNEEHSKYYYDTDRNK